MPRLAPFTALLLLQASLAVALPPDAPPPSQALDDVRAVREPAPPGERQIGLSADSLGPIFGRYALRLDLAPRRVGRWMSLAVSLGWFREDHLDPGDVGALFEGPGLGLGLEVHPLGKQLDGLSLGIEGEGRALFGEGETQLDVALGLTIGWRIVWRGSSFGVAAGARYRWRELAGPWRADRAAIEPIIRLDAGFAL